jgi:hypothetical protein
VAQLAAAAVILEAEKISTTSGKLFMLTAWCNRNKKNEDAAIVVSKALEIITSDPSYAVPMRQLRQLSEPIKGLVSNDNVPRLIGRIDLLKETSLKRPADELVRLEGVLAAIEARHQGERGLNRILEVYLGLEDLKELDERCYCLARVLVTLPEIDPADSMKLYAEIEAELEKAYDKLIHNSADQLAITRRFLRIITAYKLELAIAFASRLNRLSRREEAYRETFGAMLRALQLRQSSM